MANLLIKSQPVIETLETNYMPYAMSVIVSRALPEIDGFKPSHRKLLYTMYKMNLLKGIKVKCAKTVGATMSLNPHGDAAIYETMVRLTRGNEALLHPLIDSKGNFGKCYSRDMAYAAPRYTEAKLDQIAEELFLDMNKDTVDFIPNYDNTMQEPTLLPVTFPNILVNPNIGIAVGMASSICSFNLKEVCQATNALLKDDTASINLYLLGPDFSTGGQLIYEKEVMEKIYRTGRGSFKVRGKYKYDKKNNCIDIYELPYTTTIEAVVESVTELVKAGKIKDITDIRDETDKAGLKITIDLKRNINPHELMNKLYKLTSLQDSFSCNFNLLINKQPMVLGVKQIITEWIKFRISCIKRGIEFDIQKHTERLHLLEGLTKILLDIDKAIKIIKDTAKEKEVVINLMNGFAIDTIQAEYIADIKLRSLNKEYLLNRTKDMTKLEKEIKTLTNILNSDKRIKTIIAKQLLKISEKYGKERRTTIIDEKKVKPLTEDALIEDYNIKLFFTKENYLKKVPLTSMRGSNIQKLKDGDQVIQELDSSNKADVLLFSNKHIVYKLKAYELEDKKTSQLGDYINNILPLTADEHIVYVVATNDYNGFMLFFFENGKCAKVSLKSYKTKNNRKQLVNAYSKDNPLVRMMFKTEDSKLTAISSLDKILIFDTSQINGKAARNSKGIQVLKAKDNSTLLYIKMMDEVHFQDNQYYSGNIPAVGTYRKKEDTVDQLSILGVAPRL